MELIARADGYLPARHEIAVGEASREAPVRLELARGALLVGRVIGTGGGAISRATLHDPSSDAEAESGPEGRFEIPVEALPVTLNVSAPGHKGQRVRISETPTDEHPLIITLDTAETLRGVVITEDGAVPEGAGISWESRRGGLRTMDRFTVDSEDGTFSFDLPGPGEYLLKVGADEYQDEALPALFVGPGESIDLGVLELFRGAGVRGRVVDAESGEGLAGVSVELLPAGIALFRAVEAGLPSAVTDEDGRFGLFGVEGGRYELRARRDGYATRTDEVTVRRDEVTALDSISLDGGTEVRLRLVDRSGEPRPGLAVRVLDDQREVLVPIAVGLSDPDGHVTPLVLAAGRYRLEVEGARLLLAQQIEIPAGEDELERELTVGGVDLTGVVRRRGEPVTGGVLSLTSALDPGNSRGKLRLHGGDGRSASYGLSETGVSAAVAPDGTFRITDAPAGLLFAVWRGSEGRSVHREVLVPDQARAVLEVELGGVALTGWIREVGGSPVEGASVTVADRTGRNVGEGRSGGDGRFALSDLTPGEYRLQVTAPEHAPRILTARVAEGSPPIEVTLEPGGDGAIEVTLQRDDGSPLAGVLVSLLDRGGGVVRSLVADGHGRRHFDRLPPGEYFVVWSDPLAGVGHSPALRVPPAGSDGEDEALGWRASLPVGAALAITCARPECAGATVDLVTLHSAIGLPLGPFLPGVSAGLRFSESGDLSLGRIAPGSYVVTVWAAGNRWEMPVRAVSGGPIRLAIE